MTEAKLNKPWKSATILLLAAITITSGMVVWLNYDRSQPLEILVLPNPESLQGMIYISGVVANPGSYPLKSDDSIENIIQAAGGITSSADFNGVKLYIPQSEEIKQPQKIDINRAEVWLLQALPEIGETRAQAIIDYRNQNGPFRNNYEITKVEGISIATYEKIKHLITVVE